MGQTKEKKKKLKPLKFTVDIQNLMLMTVREVKTPGIAIGFQLTLGCLYRIAKRAVEINDEKILEELETLCLIKK